MFDWSCLTFCVIPFIVVRLCGLIELLSRRCDIRLCSYSVGNNKFLPIARGQQSPFFASSAETPQWT